LTATFTCVVEEMKLETTLAASKLQEAGTRCLPPRRIEGFVGRTGCQRVPRQPLVPAHLGKKRKIYRFDSEEEVHATGGERYAMQLGHFCTKVSRKHNQCRTRGRGLAHCAVSRQSTLRGSRIHSHWDLADAPGSEEKQRPGHEKHSTRNACRYILFAAGRCGLRGFVPGCQNGAHCPLTCARGRPRARAPSANAHHSWQVDES